MASIYRVVVNEARTGTVVMPYHVRAIYETLSGKKAFDGPVETIRDDNEINFEGSLAAGKGTDPKPYSFSTVLGKNISSEADKSFVFGEDAVLNGIHKCFYHSFDDAASLKYVRSGKTEVASGYSGYSSYSGYAGFGVQFPFELKNDTINNLRVRSVAIEAGSLENFHGVWKFRAMVVKSGGTINLEDKEKEKEIRDDFSTTSDVDLKLTSNGMEVMDNRSSGNPIFWTTYFDISELENS